MTEEELKLAYRFVCAIESIAAALSSAPVAGEPKRPVGRPRKTPVAEVVTADAAVTPEEKAAVLAPVQTEPEPTEEARKIGFAKLKTSLQNCLALHGEEETRIRLKHPKFSEVPFADIEATIARLDA